MANEFNIKRGFISNGDSSVNGKLTTQNLQITSGATNGYVLTSDASGNATWSAPTSSSGKFGIADSGGTYTYYSTLTAAMTAAVAGQTIEFFTDYTETGAVTVTLKDGVTINGNGHSYILNNSGTPNSLEISSSGTYKIYNLYVTRLGSSTANNTQNLRLYCNSSNVVCDFTGTIFSGTSSGASFIGGSGFKIKNGTFYGLGRFGLLAYGTGEVNGVEAISSSTTAGNGGAGLYAVYCDVYFSSGKGASGVGIYMDTVNLNNCYGYSVSDSGIFGGPVSYVNNSTGRSTGRYGIEDCTEIRNSVGQSTANRGISATGYIFNSVGQSSAAVGLLTTGNAANCVGYSTSSSGFGIYDGNTSASNCTSIATAAAAFTTASGIVPTTTYNNCVFESKWNNSGGHGVVIQSNNVEFNNCTFQVRNASANCLNSGSAFTVKYTHSIFKGATTPVNANITQGVTNTQDAYGNITI